MTPVAARQDWRQATREILRQDGTGHLGVLEAGPSGIGRVVRLIRCAEAGCLRPATVIRADGLHRCPGHA